MEVCVGDVCVCVCVCVVALVGNHRVRCGEAVCVCVRVGVWVCLYGKTLRWRIVV